MSTPPPETGKNTALREIMAGLSLVGFVILFLFCGSVFLFRDLPRLMGMDTAQPISGLPEAALLSVAAIVMVGILAYAGCIAWLMFAKLVFTRAEVLKIVTAKRASRFDFWLINKIYPEI